MPEPEETKEEWDINKGFEEIQKFKAEHEVEQEKKTVGYSSVLNQLLNGRKDKSRAILVKIGDLPLVKVYKNIPLDIEDKIHQYRKSIEELGEDYLPDTIQEAKNPLYLIVASLCAEAPFNDPGFWKDYDVASNGDTANVMEDIAAEIKKMKKR